MCSSVVRCVPVWSSVCTFVVRCVHVWSGVCTCEVCVFVLLGVCTCMASVYMFGQVCVHVWSGVCTWNIWVSNWTPSQLALPKATHTLTSLTCLRRLRCICDWAWQMLPDSRATSQWPSSTWRKASRWVRHTHTANTGLHPIYNLPVNHARKKWHDTVIVMKWSCLNKPWCVCVYNSRWSVWPMSTCT